MYPDVTMTTIEMLFRKYFFLYYNIGQTEINDKDT